MAHVFFHRQLWCSFFLGDMQPLLFWICGMVSNDQTNGFGKIIAIEHGEFSHKKWWFSHKKWVDLSIVFCKRLPEGMVSEIFSWKVCWKISDNVALFSCIFSPSIKIYRVSFCICSFIDGEYKQHCYLLKKQLILGLVPDCSINAISFFKKKHIQMYRLVPQVTVVHWKMLTWSWSLKIVDGWRLLQGI